MPSVFELSEYNDFFRANKSLVVAFVLSLAAPAAADYLIALGPPSPKSIIARSAITGIVAGLVSTVVFTQFYRRRKSNKERDRVAWWTLIVLVLTAGVYLATWEMFTFEDPQHVREAKGLWYTEEMDDALFGENHAKQIDGVPDLTSQLSPKSTEADILEHAGYDPMRVWTEKSVRSMRICLLFLWIAAVASLSSTICMFVASEGTIERGKQAKAQKGTRKNGGIAPEP